MTIIRPADRPQSGTLGPRPTERPTFAGWGPRLL
jgi:hypothetical protein